MYNVQQARLKKNASNEIHKFAMDADEIDRFYKFIGADGVLLTHMIKSAAGTIVFLDVLGMFWHKFPYKTIKKS